MDIINYALSKKIKRYIDDISSSNQVQSDWNQNDESAPDYVKGRTHYREYVEICEFTYEDGYLIAPVAFTSLPDSICVEINGVKFEDISKTKDYTIMYYGDDYGTANVLWANGDGYGFSVNKGNGSASTKCNIDTSRFGAKADAVVRIYEYAYEKLSYKYLPIATYNTPWSCTRKYFHRFK